MKNFKNIKINKERLKPKSTKKKLLLGVFVILLGALGLEVSNNDFSIESLFSGNSLSESKIIRDINGNIDFTGVSPLIANCESNEYNCDDFIYQEQAQDVMERCGGKGKDINRLDGDNNGVACQGLPSKK